MSVTSFECWTPPNPIFPISPVAFTVWLCIILVRNTYEKVLFKSKLPWRGQVPAHWLKLIMFNHVTFCPAVTQGKGVGSHELSNQGRSMGRWVGQHLADHIGAPGGAQCRVSSALPVPRCLSAAYMMLWTAEAAGVEGRTPGGPQKPGNGELRGQVSQDREEGLSRNLLLWDPNPAAVNSGVCRPKSARGSAQT